jgi:hypothetical protein
MLLFNVYLLRRPSFLEILDKDKKLVYSVLPVPVVRIVELCGTLITKKEGIGWKELDTTKKHVGITRDMK